MKSLQHLSHSLEWHSFLAPGGAVGHFWAFCTLRPTGSSAESALPAPLVALSCRPFSGAALVLGPQTPLGDRASFSLMVRPTVVCCDTRFTVPSATPASATSARTCPVRSCRLISCHPRLTLPRPHLRPLCNTNRPRPKHGDAGSATAAGGGGADEPAAAVAARRGPGHRGLGLLGCRRRGPPPAGPAALRAPPGAPPRPGLPGRHRRCVCLRLGNSELPLAPTGTAASAPGRPRAPA